MNYEMTPVNRGVIVRPAGCLGTVGWINGVGWEARFFRNAAQAQRWIKQQQLKEPS